MGLPLRDAQRHTYADYCTWPEDVRYELIDRVAGIAYGRPSIHETKGSLEVGSVPPIRIDWDRLVEP